MSNNIKKIFTCFIALFGLALVSCGDDIQDTNIKSADDFLNKMATKASSRVKSEPLSDSTECTGNVTLAKSIDATK